MSSEAAGERAGGARTAAPSRADSLRLVGFAALIGIPAAVVAALFLGFVHDLEHWMWTDLPSHLGDTSPPLYLVVGLPVAGAAIVLTARRLLPGDGGHPPLEGINADPTPLRYGPGVALAAVGTLGFGAVLGPEGPLIALGSLTALACSLASRDSTPFRRSSSPPRQPGSRSRSWSPHARRPRRSPRRSNRPSETSSRGAMSRGLSPGLASKGHV